MLTQQPPLGSIPGLSDRLLRSAQAALMRHLAEASSANDAKSIVALSAAAGILAFALKQEGGSLDLSRADAGVADDGKAEPEDFN